MNDRSDEQLLDDVLAEASPLDFRAAALAATLRQARNRRRWRHTRRAAGVLCVLALGTWLAVHQRPANVTATRSPLKKPVAIAPQAPYQSVETHPLPAGALIATETFASFKIISPTSIVTQISSSSDGFHYINDAQLLALAGPGAAMLVRTGPDSEELVFAASENPPANQPGDH